MPRTSRATNGRLALALLLPLLALAVQWVLWDYITPFVWFLFFPTVFASARLAGIRGGVGSAALSCLIVIYFFIEPRLSLMTNTGPVWSAIMFIGMGFVFGEVHERLDKERLKVAAALDQSEGLFRGIVEQSLAGIYVIQDDRVCYANPEFARIFGYDDPGEVIDSVKVPDLVSPSDRKRVTENIQKRLVGEVDQMRYSFKGLRRDGTVIDVQVHGSAFEYEGRPAVIGMAIDNTDRIQALEQLSVRDRLLVRTSSLAKVGGWVFDVPSMEGEWTSEIARIHDLDPATPMSATRGVTFYEGWSRDAIENAVRDAIERQQPYDLELELVSAKGVHKWVRTVGHPIVVNGKTVRVEGTMQDITDRMEAQQALARSEERYRSLIEQTVDGIFLTNAKGRFADANPAGCEMLGYSFDEIMTLGFADVIHPDEVAHMPDAFARLSEGATTRSEWRFVRKDGTEFYGEVVGRQLPDGRLLGILRDVTQRKEADEIIRELNAGLERRVVQRTTEVTAANRELEAFAHAVSHDLRAPLRAMSGFCQALLEDYGPSLDENGVRYIEHIVSASRGMGELIDGLLILSRATRGDMTRETVDVSALAERFITQSRAIHPERDVSASVEAGLQAYGDRRMLEVMMQNLINNAWKYTGRTENAQVKIRTVTTDGESWICVSDNGAGFDPRYSAQLFEPFHRLHRQDDFPGIGIGLATVQRIVNRHGGQIRADAAPGEGAEFCFWLPAEDAALEPECANR